MLSTQSDISGPSKLSLLFDEALWQPASVMHIHYYDCFLGTELIDLC